MTLEPHKINFFRATIEHMSSDHSQVLLTSISTSKEVFRDHVWVNFSKRLSKLQVNDTIAFSAIVTPYHSQGTNKLGLRHLRNVIKIKDN